LAAFPVEIDREFREDAIFDLAGRHNLTFHDSAYLELAGRVRVPLVSLDQALRSAASREGVWLVEGPPQDAGPPL
jgi:predicted nucleic acid-binding protein